MESRDRPYPPFDLANRVSSIEGTPDPYEAYEARGLDTRRSLERLLPDDWSFAGTRCLDFGCGAGRTLRQFLPEAEVAELWGVDIDRPSIDWLVEHLSPPLHAQQVGVHPPTRFADQSFDLAWAISVFTHLTDESLPWLLELHRVLKPGGLLMASYMGRHNHAAFVDEEWDESRIGMNVLRADQSWDIGGPMVLMSDWWVEAHWGRAFEVVDRIDNVQGQTWALLRRRDVELTLEDLERPADDVREVRALRHNVAQVARDERRMAGDAVERLEGSRTWRLTRPAREAARLARGLRDRRS